MDSCKLKEPAGVPGIDSIERGGMTMDFHDILEQATVQYGDGRGTIAVDGYNHWPLQALMTQNGIDGKYFPVAFSQGGVNNNSLTVLAVDRTEIETTGSSIAEQIQEHSRQFGTENPLPVHSFEIETTPEELAAMFKRWSVLVRWREIDPDVPLGIVEYHERDE